MYLEFKKTYVQVVMFIENKPKGCFVSGCFVPLDVLSLWTFVPMDVLSAGCFVPQNILSLWTFCPTDVMSPAVLSPNVVSPDVLSPDVLSGHRYAALICGLQ
jgi:hypothetical protein